MLPHQTEPVALKLIDIFQANSNVDLPTILVRFILKDTHKMNVFQQSIPTSWLSKIEIMVVTFKMLVI